MILDAPDPRAIVAIDDYVRKTRRWEKDRYDIRLYLRDADRLTFSVIHKPDGTNRQGPTVESAAGKSFSVEVDAKSQQVLGELPSQ